MQKTTTKTKPFHPNIKKAIGSFVAITLLFICGMGSLGYINYRTDKKLTQYKQALKNFEAAKAKAEATKANNSLDVSCKQ